MSEKMTCRRCRKSLADLEFRYIFNKRGTDGKYSRTCKLCECELKAEHYRSEAEAIRKERKRREEERRFTHEMFERIHATDMAKETVGASR